MYGISAKSRKKNENESVNVKSHKLGFDYDKEISVFDEQMFFEHDRNHPIEKRGIFAGFFIILFYYTDGRIVASSQPHG